MSCSSNKKIYKNTVYLYIRMFIMMAISLYSSRVVLQMLGITDYGLYNVVGGFVSFFFFISSTLATATQRFMAFEMGRGNEEGKKRVFSLSVVFFLILSLVILLLGILIGVPYVKYKLNVAPGREEAALIVYLLSLTSAIFTFVRVPYNASIIANEKMSFYSWISVLESLLKLLVLFLIIISTFDKLILYATLQLFVVAGITFTYYIYCKVCFNDFEKKGIFDRRLMGQLFSYCGWNFVGGFSDVIVAQGLTLILNQFFGTVVNAAQALAMQIKGQIAGFVSNLSVASSPAIVKSYASKEVEQFKRILFLNSKIAYMMLLILSLPIALVLPFILDLWLGVGSYPDYTITFTRLVLINTLIDTLPGLSNTSIQATGQIKRFQLIMAIYKIAPILLTIPILYIYNNPVVSYAWLILLSIPKSIHIIRICCKLTEISASDFYRKVIWFDIFVTVVALSGCISIFVVVSYLNINYYLGNILELLSAGLVCCLACFFVGLSKEERKSINNIIKRKIKK